MMNNKSARFLHMYSIFNYIRKLNEIELEEFVNILDNVCENKMKDFLEDYSGSATLETIDYTIDMNDIRHVLNGINLNDNISNTETD